ncbi:MAG: Asp-tRNA(Asn)/Glu-tRNA(Gln) amidotransferase subunit GatA [Tissierellaceae bacterium]
MMNIIDLKAYEMKEKLLKREISSREIVEAHLDRIKEVEDNINAFITVDEENALSSADIIDEKIKSGEKLGVLAGLPIAIKDNIMTKGIKTTAGSKMLSNFISPYDATVIEKIKKNHGIILGKTNMDEFSMGGTTETSYFGATKNPLDNTRTTGGSSGGSAAAVVARETPLAIGSDTGGSIRKPAGYCGLVGIKPTYGLVSRYGLIPLSNTMDQIGVFGRDVKDAVLMLNAISGKDTRDISTVDSSNIDVEDSKSIDCVKGMKIALPKEFFTAEMDAKVKEEMKKSIDIFKNLGGIIEEISLPSLKYALEIYHIITSGDISSNMARFDGIRYGYRAEDYDTLDELYINSRTEGFGEEVKRRILFGTYLLSGYRGKEYYDKALKARTDIIEGFNDIFSKFDIILSPTSPDLPPKLGETRSEVYSHSEGLFQVPVNLAGLCAVSVPTVHGEGLPVGLQIIGDRFKEENIIKAAFAYERMVK